MNYIPDTVNNAYEKMPTAVKHIIDDPYNTLTIKRLSEKYSLRIDQAGKLADATMLAMVGLIRDIDLPKEIEQMVSVDTIKAGEIATTLDREILHKIKALKAEDSTKDTLRQSHNQTDDLKTTFANQYAALPPAIKEIIDRGDWAKTTAGLASMYFLNTEQATELKNEVSFVLLGMEDPDNLPTNITNNVGTSTDTAAQITEAINRQILNPINDTLQEITAAEVPTTDPLAEARAKFTKIADHGRFPTETLISRFEMLPKNVQTMISGSDIAKVMSPLAAKYDLHIDQAGVLAELAILVMLGLVKTTEFISDIERYLGVTKIKAGDIAYEIDQKLFKPIRDDLKAIAAMKEAAEAKPTITPAISNTLPPEASNIIHPHPANRPYYGSVPKITPASPVTPAPTQTSGLTEKKLNTVVSAPKQEINVTRNVDPYREPLN